MLQMYRRFTPPNLHFSTLDTPDPAHCADHCVFLVGSPRRNRGHFRVKTNLNRIVRCQPASDIFKPMYRQS